MVAAVNGMACGGRMAFGDLVRMTLMGAHERMSAATARAAGLVSEVVPAAELPEAAHRLAATIARQTPSSVQASLRALWAARSLPHHEALALGNVFLQMGSATEARRQGQESFAGGQRVEWRLR